MDRLAALLEFYEADPDDAFTRFALAQEYLKRGEPEQALAFFERLAADRPDYTGTYYHLGKLYALLGRNADAEAAYERGIAAAQAQRNQKDLSELYAALQALRNPDFYDD